MMALFSLLIWFVIAGILWWAINAIVAAISPWLAEPFPTLIRVVLILSIAWILISAILQIAGMGGSLGMHVPMLR